MYITQADRGSNFYIEERDRLERVAYVDEERQVRKERHQFRMERMAEHSKKYGVSSILGGGGEDGARVW
ncbi:hypothetical protein HDU67_002316 [Dinochytrium kinnereticum]|nr:hypothetical protein HDU67_002316 [Dinochytrium kinnereticum]